MEAKEPRGPFIGAALLCERVLEEKDGVLSAIRIVDRWIVPRPFAQNDEQITALLRPVMVVVLKAGEATGSHTISVNMSSPNGNEDEGIAYPFELEGEDRGVNLVVPTLLEIQQEGLYWFNVRIDGVLETRIPLRVAWQQDTELSEQTQ